MSKKLKGLVFYIITILVLGLGMWYIVMVGEAFQGEEASELINSAPKTLVAAFDLFKTSLLHHIHEPLAILFLQIVSILLVARLFGWFFTRIGQPSVIAEIVAGIFLGPSILGRFFPEVSGFLFAPESLGNLTILSQFGLVLFMFAIGMELDITEVRKRLRETVLISHTSTIVPFFLGMLLAYFFYDAYAYKSTPFVSFALFIGVSMSITAFPVLARIIQEKGMTKSHLGTITLASAANGDVTAWCLLAVVIAIAQAGSMLSALYNIFFSILYIVIMFMVVRPFLRILGNLYHNKEVLNKGMVASIFMVLIISAYFTEILGLHALFGAFIAGVVMPSNVEFRKIMTEKVEDVSLSLLLPLFFVSTGLRTDLGLLNEPSLIGMCLLVIFVAIIGKFGGAAISARVVGENWKNSFYIGAFMNTRGLMELVVLTIGYEMGILTPPIFVMLVLMTLVTTFMTSPLVSLIDIIYKAREKRKMHVSKLFHKVGGVKVLLSFGRAKNGKVLLEVATRLFYSVRKDTSITALHLTVGTDVNPLMVEEIERKSFAPIREAAKEMSVDLHTKYGVSNNAGQEIVDMVNGEGYDFLLVGAGISMSNVPSDMEVTRQKNQLMNMFGALKPKESWFYPGYLLKDKTKMFIKQTQCTVGVFVNRGFSSIATVLMIVDEPRDLFMLDYAKSLAASSMASVLVVSSLPETEANQHVYSVLRQLENEEARFRFVNITLTEAFKRPNALMVISYEAWNKLSETENVALQEMPSTLIISKKNS
ncbi:MAG: cation:proton antiporter [Tannerellaceae bacterium]